MLDKVWPWTKLANSSTSHIFMTVSSASNALMTVQQMQKTLRQLFKYRQCISGTFDIFSNITLKLFTDSSGLGYAACFVDQWFFGEWSSQWWKDQHIMILELYPIVLALEVWGELLQNKRIMIMTDNQALVPVINKQTSKDPTAMILVRRLVLSCLKNNILFKAEHVPGVLNGPADALSRLKIDTFRKMCPNAANQPMPIPPLPYHLSL